MISMSSRKPADGKYGDQQVDKLLPFCLLSTVCECGLVPCRCREKDVSVARSAIIGRDTAIGSGSKIDEGCQVRDLWSRVRKH